MNELTHEEVQQMVAPYLLECCESQLLGYGESDTSGTWVKFRLPDRDHLSKIDGKKGQRFILMTIEIADDETLVPQGQKDEFVRSPPTQHALSRLAGRWCREVSFRNWLSDEFPDEATCLPVPLDEDGAATILRHACRVDSRAELDTSIGAADRFHKIIRTPYMQIAIPRAVKKVKNDRDRETQENTT